MDPSLEDDVNIGPCHGKPTAIPVERPIEDYEMEELPESSFLHLRPPLSQENNKPSTSKGKEGDDYNAGGFYYDPYLRALCNKKPPKEENRNQTIDKWVVVTKNDSTRQTQVSTERNNSSTTDISWKFPILMIASSERIRNHLEKTGCRTFGDSKHPNHRKQNIHTKRGFCTQCCILIAGSHYSENYNRLNENSFNYEIDQFESDKKYPSGSFTERFNFLLPILNEGCNLFDGLVSYKLKCTTCGNTIIKEDGIHTASAPIKIDATQEVKDLLLLNATSCLQTETCGECLKEGMKILPSSIQFIKPPEVIQVRVQQRQGYPARVIRITDLNLEFPAADSLCQYELTAAYCRRGVEGMVIMCRGEDAIYYEYNDTFRKSTICTRGRLLQLQSHVMIYTKRSEERLEIEGVVLDPDRRKRCVYTGLMIKEPEIEGLESIDVLPKLQNIDERDPITSIEYYIGLYSGGHRVRPGHFYKSNCHDSSIYRTMMSVPRRRVFQGPIITKESKTDMRRHEAFFIAFGRAAQLRAKRTKTKLSQRMVNITLGRNSEQDRRIASMLVEQGEDLFCFDQSHPAHYHEIPGFNYHVGIHVNMLDEITPNDVRTAPAGTKAIGKSGNLKVFPCVEPSCAAKFDEYRKVKRHVLCRHPEKIYPCYSCNQWFIRIENWRGHVRGIHRRYLCLRCGEDFQSKPLLDNHRNKQHNGEIGVFECERCGRGFSSEEILKDHTKSKHEGNPYRCDLCPATFVHKVTFVEHKRYKHEFDNLASYNSFKLCQRRKKGQFGRGYYQCKHCGRHFGVNFLLLRHINEVHPTEREIYLCEYCGKQYRGQCGLRNHVRSRHKQLKYNCRECGKIYKSHHGMNEHIKRKHHKIVETISCEICGKQYTTRNGLLYHTKVEHNDVEKTLYRCEPCNKVFRSENTLLVHIKGQHNSSPKPSLVCKECGREYKSNQGLKRHTVAAHGDKQLRCTHCKINYRSEKGYSNHMNTKHGSEKILCTTCKTSFSSKSSLNNHLKRKHGPPSPLKPKPYKCQHCILEFTNKKHFHVHNRTQHPGAQQVQHLCQICKKSFTAPESLRRHNILIHNLDTRTRKKCEKKPIVNFKNVRSRKERAGHVCEKCGKKFSKKMDFITHEMSNTCEKKKGNPIKCKYCDNTYKTPGGVKNHIRYTHEKVSHDCGKCGKKYSDIRDLNTHIITKACEK